MLTNSSELSQFSLLLGKPKKMDNVGNLDDKRDNQDVPEDLDNLSEHLDDTMSNLESDDEKNEDDNSEVNENEDILNDPDFQNMSDSDGDDLPLFGNLSDDEIDDEGEGTFKEREKNSGIKSQVDDQFFKLADMEKFLDKEDRRELEKGKKEETDEDINFFDDIPEDDEENVMYKEYFENASKNDDEEDLGSDS